MRKLTKDQRYYRKKKKKDAKRDFRRTNREDGTHGVRVSSKPFVFGSVLKHFISYQALQQIKD